MIRFVVIIVFIAACFYVLRYLTKVIKQEAGRKSERGTYQYQTPKYGNTEDEYRRTLGITSVDDPATIRKKYIELLEKYHPDKVHHLGIEFQEMAERKTRAIMEAYEFFQKKS